MGLWSELKVLYHITLKPIRGKDHAARLESFYAGQAEGYDDFRRRLLKGREALWAAIEVPEAGVWVDLGGGTGTNLEHFGPLIEKLRQVYVVDLSPSLLEVARKRIDKHGWTNVEAVEADATTWQPPTAAADVVTFSYSLTMMPDWFAAIENARAMLKLGGRIGVVDFYVSRKYPVEGLKRHSWFTRTFWPTWFHSDNVFLSPDHVPYLRRRFECVHFTENRARQPYIPLLRVPYYTFVGRRRQED
jgi:S-adenosylmethionine-diacylgycerolhomoserine-N-methlytransferase